jgi:SMODS and SLOG-associating 2TM effector domain 1
MQPSPRGPGPVTARELCLFGTHAEALADDIDEDRWAESVEDAEQAISREHTLWLARRAAVPV